MQFRKISEEKQWLFCTLFPLVLNLIALTVWSGMFREGVISKNAAILTGAYLALALVLSLRAIQLKMRAERRAVREQVQQATDSGTTATTA